MRSDKIDFLVKFRTILLKSTEEKQVNSTGRQRELFFNFELIGSSIDF